MTASEVVSGWPEATVERAAEAVYESISAGWSTALPWGLAHDDWRSEARQCARAALSVLPDPTADTAERHACWCYRPGSCAKCGRPEGEHHNNQRHLIRDVQTVVDEWESSSHASPAHSVSARAVSRIAALLAGSGE